MSSASFLFLSPALPSELLTYILNHDTYPTTLIICSTRADFISSLVDDARSETALKNAPAEDAAEAPDVQDDKQDQEARRRRFLSSPLYQVATSRHIRVVYIPTVTHLRAYLSVFSPEESPIPAPPANFETSRDECPRMILFGFLDMHRDTSEWSAQGLSNSLSTLVELAYRLSWEANIIEPRNRDSSHTFEDVLKEHVPFLSGGGRRPGLNSDEGGWLGRTVEVGRVMKRWFRFERGQWDASSSSEGT
ncbi:hypothetical protein F4821DRAFT_229674 [Hypoxylon rubiginosum]|uniref:Uncharacterized protein n=1 Tax=Hypoxylon rubiginosum TaxID=110542 RepID=A0ACC0DBX7_9PEZI|nr:hypothetical protein F4821DRAFT_229674 [Hypoxylon rubiginosum]